MGIGCNPAYVYEPLKPALCACLHRNLSPQQPHRQGAQRADKPALTPDRERHHLRPRTRSGSIHGARDGRLHNPPARLSQNHTRGQLTSIAASVPPIGDPLPIVQRTLDNYVAGVHVSFEDPLRLQCPREADRDAKTQEIFVETRLPLDSVSNRHIRARSVCGPEKEPR